MNRLKEKQSYTQVLIIGSGIIGKFNALELAKLGFKVLIIDPCQITNSSNAALGLLMGKIYQKRTGRSWQLRESSIRLWPKWLKEFKDINPKVAFEKPLIKLTTNEAHFEKMRNFVLKYPNDNLEILNKDSKLLGNIQKFFNNNNNIKGIVSHEDGRINPKILLDSIDSLLTKYNIFTKNDTVLEIKKDKKSWIVLLKSGKEIISKVVVVCNSLNSLKIINNSHKIKLQPVIGQAIELSIKDTSTNILDLPKVFSINGKNFIPLSKDKLIIGSTDEYDLIPKEEKIEELFNFIKDKPLWLDIKNITRKWYGIRSKPVGEGSPILKILEEGLILCTGFYKNGILLAPACSHWISNEVKKYF